MGRECCEQQVPGALGNMVLWGVPKAEKRKEHPRQWEQCNSGPTTFKGEFSVRPKEGALQAVAPVANRDPISLEMWCSLQAWGLL